MSINTLLIALAVLAIIAYWSGVQRAKGSVGSLANIKRLHSRPTYHGLLMLFGIIVPAVILLIGLSAFENSIAEQMMIAQVPQSMLPAEGQSTGLLLTQIRNAAFLGDSADPALLDLNTKWQSIVANLQTIKYGLTLAIPALVAMAIYFKINPTFRARNRVESVVKWILMTCASLAILTTVGIVFSVLFESIRFFNMIPFTDFMFGTHYSPSSDTFGAVPLFAGTALISLIALLVSVPLGLLSAIYLSEYATPRIRAVAKPALEVLAGIPTVVYGVFAALTIAPAIRSFGETIGLSVSSESALAAGLVMGVMIIPFVSSLSDDVINAVPQSLRDGAYGLGSTRSETIRKVIFPAALPGIVGSVLLAASRAIGETMIVVMAAGLAANLTANPLEAVTTVTVQMVTALVGDQEFESPKTLVAFALGLVLFVATLLLNVIALHVVRRYREQYD
ncbi:MAG: phosphate ABC transporter permease subunit PstC [Gammaproteobacteria bacterium]|nr:phosphate ABC transporter permease subunit PstC [Gammaproteobacteria bacterium]